jgi:hypothetical protein
MTISGSGSIPPSLRAINSRTAQAYGIQPRVPAQAPQAEKAAAPGATGIAPNGSEGLRAVLNDEERAYFDQIASLGPITYGRNRTAGVQPEVPTGLRIDVRG